MVHLLRNGTFIAPFYIFIRCSEAATEEILRVLKLSEWEYFDGPMEQSFKSGYRHFYLTRTEKWLHIMDDGYYTLWNDQEFRKKLPALSHYFPIYTCWVGDSDDSFGYQIFKNKELVRESIVEDPDRNGILKARDQGKRLVIEKDVMRLKYPEDKVLSVAKGLGIDVKHNLEDIKVYWKKIGPGTQSISLQNVL